MVGRKVGKSIQDFWTEFQLAIMPLGASAIQVTEMRKAFFSGFMTMLLIVIEIGEPQVPEELGIQYLEQLRKEMNEYAKHEKEVADAKSNKKS